MQNNVTEITQKLLGAIDGDYNVTHMATIVEVISVLEKAPITKEMLEATRLGKHINEVRKNLGYELARRCKMLVKKWRNIVLGDSDGAQPSPPTTNGQLRPAVAAAHEGAGCGGGGNGKKRPASRQDAPQPQHAKRHRVNGGGAAPTFDYDFSDNSNSSLKDIAPSAPVKTTLSLVGVNSDSNSSMSEHVVREPVCEEQQPKKRGRKKGSKNHKNLIEEAESSFSNKMAVSRGNAKVKTTQELIESLQNKALPPLDVPPAAPTPTSPTAKDGWRERAAKLTERVSLIDQKLNSGGHRSKKQRGAGGGGGGGGGSVSSNNNREAVIRARAVTPDDDEVDDDDEDDEEDDDEDDEEIIVVDDVAPAARQPSGAGAPTDATEFAGPRSLSVDDALRLLPPVVPARNWRDKEAAPACWCELRAEERPESDAEAATAAADELLPPPAMAFVEHRACPARDHYEEKYRLNDASDALVGQLHDRCVDGINGNYCEARLRCEPPLVAAAAAVANLPEVPSSHVVDIVPKFHQLPAKSAACSETFKRYSISEAGGGDDGDGGGGGERASTSTKRQAFGEFHECLEKISYNDEVLRILPYVIID